MFLAGEIGRKGSAVLKKLKLRKAETKALKEYEGGWELVCTMRVGTHWGMRGGVVRRESPKKCIKKYSTR